MYVCIRRVRARTALYARRRRAVTFHAGLIAAKSDGCSGREAGKEGRGLKASSTWPVYSRPGFSASVRPNCFARDALWLKYSPRAHRLFACLNPHPVSPFIIRPNRLLRFVSDGRQTYPTSRLRGYKSYPAQDSGFSSNALSPSTWILLLLLLSLVCLQPQKPPPRNSLAQTRETHYKLSNFQSPPASILSSKGPKHFDRISNDNRY